MRLLFFGVLLASTAASANTPRIPEGAPVRLQLEAKISRASCMASEALNAIPRDHVDITRLDEAVGPANALLDDVIAAGDPEATLIAERTKADLYVALVVRARNSVPPISSMTVGPTLAMHDELHARIEAQVQPWLDRADVAYRAVSAIASRHPELDNPVVRTAARESEQATAPQSAER